MNSVSEDTNHRQTRTVDGVFQMIGQHVEAPSDTEEFDGDPSTENNAMASVDNGDSSDEDLTYNSQGKPIPRKKLGDKK